MGIPPVKFREVVFQLLVSQDYYAFSDEEIIPFIMKEIKVSYKDVFAALQRMNQICEKNEDLDREISAVSTSYALNRIQRIERNILRLGIYELLFDSSMPDKVAISEALRLCRKFSTKEAANFVNALLDKIYKKKTEIGLPKESTAIESICHSS